MTDGTHVSLSLSSSSTFLCAEPVDTEGQTEDRAEETVLTPRPTGTEGAIGSWESWICASSGHAHAGSAAGTVVAAGTTGSGR